LIRAGREHTVVGDHMVLQAGDVIVLRFDALPGDGGAQLLSVRLRGLAYHSQAEAVPDEESGSEPAAIPAGPLELPRISVLAAGTVVLPDRSLVEERSGLEEIVKLSFQASQAPIAVHLDAGHGFEGRLLAMRDQVVLVGEARSTATAWLRLAAGLAALLVLAVGTGAVLSTVLSDALAVGIGGILLAIGFLRGTLLEVASAVMEFHHEVATWIRALAQIAHDLLTLCPDLADLRGSRLFVEAVLPFSELDPGPFLAVPVLVAIQLGVGWLLVGKVRRWFS
jgi:hypothetical protein